MGHFFLLCINDNGVISDHISLEIVPTNVFYVDSHSFDTCSIILPSLLHVLLDIPLKLPYNEDNYVN